MGFNLGKAARKVGRAASGAAKGVGKAAKGAARGVEKTASGVAKGVGRAAGGAGKEVGKAVSGAGKAVGRGAADAAKFSASAAKKVAKEAKKLEKPLDIATDVFAVVGGPPGVEAKLVKEAIKFGLKNASHPQKVIQGAVKGLSDFVKDPGCAVWLANPQWWQLVGSLMAVRDAGVIKNRTDAKKFLKQGGAIAASAGVPKDLSDSFFECAAKQVFP